MHKMVIAIALALGVWASPALAQDSRLVYPFDGLTVERFLLLSVIQQDLVVLATVDSINLAMDFFAQQAIRCGPVLGVSFGPVQVADVARARMATMEPEERTATSAPMTIILTALDQGCTVVPR